MPTGAGDPSTTTLPRVASGSDAPDWNYVPFEVSCARCGNDLRGLTEPACPTCGFEFDWDEAVPIEQLTCSTCDYRLYGLTNNRCPECGEEFTWEDALDRHARQRKPLFENRWRDETLRSFVRTWRWTLWPPKIWRFVDLHDPPRLRALVAFVLIMHAAFYLCASLLVTVEIMLAGGLGIGATASFGALVQNFAARLVEAMSGRFGVEEAFWLFACWTVCTLLALLVFQQSMRRSKVKAGHVLRVAVFATQAIPILVLLVVHGLLISESVGWIRGVPGDAYPLFFVLLFAIWSIRRAYRDYLRIPHSLAVAIASQLMAGMGAICLIGVVLGQRDAASIVLSLMRALGVS